jgi:hypothetical protein
MSPKRHAVFAEIALALAGIAGMIEGSLTKDLWQKFVN